MQLHINKETTLPIPVTAILRDSVRRWDEKTDGPRLQFLAHLRDGIVKHPSSIISTFPYQFDLPCSGREPQVGRFQPDNLLGYLDKDGLALTSPTNMKCRAQIPFNSIQLKNGFQQ